MKRCSYCGRENDLPAVNCWECGTEFGSEPAEVDSRLQDPQLSLVIVATYLTVVDATVDKTRLESAGIEACIPEEYAPQIFWAHVPSPLERVTLRVAAKDYELAKEILSSNS